MVVDEADVLSKLDCFSHTEVHLSLWTVGNYQSSLTVE